MKVCVTNGEYIDYQKLQYFPNYFKGSVANWFGRYETVHPTTTWAKVQHEIRIEGQAIATL
jgi:hypothetical protein